MERTIPLIPDRFVNDVNEVMAGNIGEMGAYCMGMLMHLGLTTGRFPPRPVLEVASKAQSLQDAIEIYGAVSTYENERA